MVLLYRIISCVNDMPLSPLTSHFSRLISHLSFLTSHFSPLISHFTPLTSHFSRLSPLISHFSFLTSHLSPLISHFSPLTSHFSFLTSHLSPLTSHLIFFGIVLCFFVTTRISVFRAKKIKKKIKKNVRAGDRTKSWRLVCIYRNFGLPTRNFCIWFNENFSENCQKSIFNFIEFSWVSVWMRRLRRLVYTIAVCWPAD